MELGLESLENLERRWTRLTRMKDALEKQYEDTTKYTFHAGLELGHLMGRINEIENQIDRIEEHMMTRKMTREEFMEVMHGIGL